jgi:hypothetical protein
MRSSTAGEQTILAATDRQCYVRVKVDDGTGTMQDMSSFGGYAWLADVTIDENIDEPIASATVTLRREQDNASSSNVTLSPYRTDSPLNVTGPAVTVYRAITIDVAVVAGTGRPAGGSTAWKRKFDGLTDRVSMPDNNTIVITGRDKGAYLIDQWIGDPRDLIAIYFNGRQQTLEKLINALLIYAPIGGTPPTVYVPTDPTFIVTSFPMQFEPVMTALQRAAELGVCDFRYAWDDGTGAYRPTLGVPARSPASAATIGSALVVGWQQFELDRLEVRNTIVVSYRPKNSTSRATVTVTDATSATTYGKRVLTIQEADDSPIDTSAEATTMANLILADLKDPKAKGEIEILPDWRIELNDYLTFSANKYFDIAQGLAVVGIKHELAKDRQRTFLTVRGLPSAGYQRWRRRAAQITPTEDPTSADNGLTNVQHTDDDVAGTRTYTWERGPEVAFVAFYETLVAPGGASAFPNPEDVVGMVASGTAGASILSSTTDTWVASKPPRGKQRFAIAVPYFKLGGRTVVGSPLKFILDPLPSNLAVTIIETNDSLTDGYVNLSVLVFGSPSDWPVTLEVWLGAETGSATYTYTVNATLTDADASAMHLKNLALPSINHRLWSAKATNVGGEIARTAYTERNALAGAEPSVVIGIGNNQSTSDLTAKAYATVSAPSNATSMKWLASTSSQPSAASVISGGTVVSSGAPIFAVSDLGVTLSLGDTVYFTAVYYDVTGSRTTVQGKKTRENINATRTTRIAAAGLFAPYDPSTQTADTTNGYYHTTGQQGNLATLAPPQGCTLTAVRVRGYSVPLSISGSQYFACFLYRVVDGTRTQLGSEFDTTGANAWGTASVSSLTEDTTNRGYQLVCTSTQSGAGTATPDYRLAYVEYDVTIPNLFVG